ASPGPSARSAGAWPPTSSTDWRRCSAVPAIIDSAPDCIIHISGAKPADDSADFILQAAYLKCQGFATFGPGSTYGEDGSAATTAYYVLTWLGIGGPRS